MLNVEGNTLDLTSGRVLAVMGGKSAPDEELVAAASERSAKLAPTLLTVWEQEGRELSAPLQEHLRMYRARDSRHQAIFNGLKLVNTQVHLTKGLELQGLYPDGILREARDLDVVALDDCSYFDAVEYLRLVGFEAQKAAIEIADEGTYACYIRFVRIDGEQHRLGSVVDNDYVELANYSLVGNKSSVLASRHDLRSLSANSRSFIAILRERFEQAYRARDLIDSYVCLEGMASDERRDLVHLIREFKVEPEAIEIAELLQLNALSDSLTIALRSTPGFAAAERAEKRRRIRATARKLLNPDLATALLFRSVSPSVRKAVDWADRFRLCPSPTPLTALDGGIRVQATPIEGQPSRAISLDASNENQPILQTPAGPFALTIRYRHRM